MSSDIQIFSAEEILLKKIRNLHNALQGDALDILEASSDIRIIFFDNFLGVVNQGLKLRVMFSVNQNLVDKNTRSLLRMMQGHIAFNADLGFTRGTYIEIPERKFFNLDAAYFNGQPITVKRYVTMLGSGPIDLAFAT